MEKKKRNIKRKNNNEKSSPDKTYNGKEAEQDFEPQNESEVQKRWFEVHANFPISTEMLDMKDNKLNELNNICRTAYEHEKATFLKKNRKDATWLQTALRKGTARDRANAGALLVTSNPLVNLEPLDVLVGFCKFSNKASLEVIGIVLDLWQNMLLPPHRKLYSLQMRGADWKELCTNETLTKEQKHEIYAYWYFEAELKERYFEFLKNIQQALQNGQENNKATAIVTASQLLIYAPEKEQMLLTMLINKLGDPSSKIASKALHHLIAIANKHPNMCPVIVNETEKLLFRNNISERAQHFGLCYLASIASLGRTDVCTKLINVCFALFKVLIQKGAVNNRTMQAILRCLQKAISQVNSNNDTDTELLSSDMQDTVYRLVHLADIRISVQTLGLLLQLVMAKSQKNDRFYNALYGKLLDMNVITIGTKTASHFLHIIHRAIHIDTNVRRAQAFIKRLLQLGLYLPANMAAGCLIVVRKLLYNRKELSWCKKSHNGKLAATFKETFEAGERKTKEIVILKYNPYHRVPAFCGIEFTTNNELLLFQKHYHPTIQVFAENILNNKKIDYFGDPLRDFGLPHFLERFSFKNPKKLEHDKTENSTYYQKNYKPIGARGLPVKMLTKANCTEDEMFIFNYMELKRQKMPSVAANDNNNNDEEIDIVQTHDVSDDEFEDYLDGFFNKKSKRSSREENNELDFMKVLNEELGSMINEKKKTNKKTKSDVEDIDADWEENESDDNEQDDLMSESEDDEDDEDNDDDVDDDDDDDIMSSDVSDDFASESDDGLSPTKAKRMRTKDTPLTAVNVDEKNFAKKLKHSTDMRSLFAAADDFAELLQDNSTVKGQGTTNAVFNKDKSSDKQLKWEEKRRSNVKQQQYSKGKKSFRKTTHRHKIK